MKKKKRKIYQIFLRMTLLTATLLLSLILINTAYRVLTDTSKNSTRSVLSQNSPDSRKEIPREEIRSIIQTVSDSESSNSSSSLSAESPSKTASEKESAKQDSLDDENKSGQNASDSKNKDSRSSEKTADTTLVFAGDVYFSDYVLANYNQSGIQGVLSESLLKELTKADITMVNHEFPFSTRGSQAPDKQFTFRTDPSYVSILKESGTDVVSLANNHVLDYGTDALSDTFQTLDEAGISYAGAGDSIERASRLITKKANGKTFGFLAASRVFPVVSWNVENAQPGVFSAYDPARLTAAVSDAKKHCDFLCVYLHWGIERNTTPEQYQISMAHAFIDAGADAVIGAHPHVLQGVEYYNGKPIFYSLGNFIFYQTIEQTAIAKLTLRADNTAVWQLLPAKASNACTSLITDAAACSEFYQRMEELSVNTKFTKKGKVLPE